ncbi:SUF system Fe-S cluster assembly protein [Rickettsiella massiliensis]|uniref:SUF system Fe-S cluster assembly protein n=1 Tax=Rickettsiella massiliensis TaxID=676517 RepID=UPI00029A1259|nr:SUF system Fe-S cluster assembly protein [Rickettsiella massiliensis]
MLPSYPLSDEAIQQLHSDIIAALKGIYDPEIPVNIYDLGLIYEIRVNFSGQVNIDMTLTTPHCPVAQTFPSQVETTVSLVPGVTEAQVTLVWDPPWTMEKMSEAAKLQLNML